MLDMITRAELKKIASQTADLTNNGQIKGFDVKTQAQYTALTTEEKNDGTVYMIKG